MALVVLASKPLRFTNGMLTVEICIFEYEWETRCARKRICLLRTSIAVKKGIDGAEDNPMTSHQTTSRSQVFSHV